MPLHVRSATKVFTADVTFEGFFSGVGALVPREVVTMAERFVAFVALIRACVAVEAVVMLLEPGEGHEGLAADQTRVRLHIRVGGHDVLL